MENDKLINDLLRMSEMNSMSLWKRDVCKRAADALSIPAVDAVEVVRCGECIYWEDDWEPSMCNSDTNRHYCVINDLFPTGDWFCKEGQRREDGDA